MAQRFYGDPLAGGVGYPVIGANSITFSAADPVVINSSGFLDLSTTSTKILGWAIDDSVVMTSTNQTVAFVCPKYVEAKNVKVVLPTASAVALTQTSVGEYFVLSGTTSGAFTVNTTSSATVGQLLCLGFNPDNDGTTTDGVFKVAADAGETTVS